MSHSNDANECAGCSAVIARYPGTDPDLVSWFWLLREKNHDLHTSCAGRGREDQEACFSAGTSKAHWTQSAHNWNCALDLFRIDENGKASWDAMWYNNVLSGCPEIGDWLTWGRFWTTFKEYPHLELTNWRDMAKSGIAKLVEK